MSKNIIHLYLHVVPENPTPEEAVLKRAGFKTKDAPGLPSDKWQQKQSGNGKRRGRPKGSRNKPKEEKYVFGSGYAQPKKRGRPF